MLEALLTGAKAVVTLGGVVPALTRAIQDLIREWKSFTLGQRLQSGALKSKETKDTSELEHALDRHP